MVRMALPKANQDGYTYQDYLTWNEGRYELIDGVVFDMTPAPSRRHQEVLAEILVQLVPQMRSKGCRVYAAPFDVRLPCDGETSENTKNVVQPDITVVCDKSKLDDAGCKGAPDLIVEVTSPGTVKRDMKNKLLLYQKAGVREYWIVYPRDKIIMVYTLEGDKYGPPETYVPGEEIPVGIVGEVNVDVAGVFAEYE